jgi:hypothetical protein
MGKNPSKTAVEVMHETETFDTWLSREKDGIKMHYIFFESFMIIVSKARCAK